MLHCIETSVSFWSFLLYPLVSPLVQAFSALTNLVLEWVNIYCNWYLYFPFMSWKLLSTLKNMNNCLFFWYLKPCHTDKIRLDLSRWSKCWSWNPLNVKEHALWSFWIKIADTSKTYILQAKLIIWNSIDCLGNRVRVSYSLQYQLFLKHIYWCQN